MLFDPCKFDVLRINNFLKAAGNAVPVDYVHPEGKVGIQKDLFQQAELVEIHSFAAVNGNVKIGEGFCFPRHS